MKSFLAVVSMFVVSSSAFATSESCQNARANAQKSYRQTLIDINAGVKTGEISKQDAELYKKNASLILAQAEAICSEAGE